MRTTVVALVLSLAATACGPGGDGGAAGDFGLNDVVLSGSAYPDGVGLAPAFFHMGWANCPSDVDCDDLLFTVFRGSRSVDLGVARDFPTVSATVLQDLADLLLDSAAGPEVEVKAEYSGARAFSTTFGPIGCPDPVQNLRVDGAAPPIATPGTVQVAWDPLVGVAADSGELLAANSSVLTASEWDDDLGLDLGTVHVAQVAATATDHVVPLDNPRLAESDRLLVQLSAGGEVFYDPSGVGEGTCNVTGAIALDLL